MRWAAALLLVGADAASLVKFVGFQEKPANEKLVAGSGLLSKFGLSSTKSFYKTLTVLIKSGGGDVPDAYAKISIVGEKVDHKVRLTFNGVCERRNGQEFVSSVELEKGDTAGQTVDLKPDIYFTESEDLNPIWECKPAHGDKTRLFAGIKTGWPPNEEAVPFEKLSGFRYEYQPKLRGRRFEREHAHDYSDPFAKVQITATRISKLFGPDDVMVQVKSAAAPARYFPRGADEDNCVDGALFFPLPEHKETCPRCIRSVLEKLDEDPGEPWIALEKRRRPHHRVGAQLERRRHPHRRRLALLAAAPAKPAAAAKPFYDPFAVGMYYPFAWWNPYVWMYWNPMMWMYYPYMMWW